MKAFRLLPLFIVALLLGGCASLNEPKLKTAEDIVLRATDTVDRFKTFPELKQFTADLGRARAVAVFPRLIKAGFIGGAEGGNGLIVKRGPDGRFGPPAFYTLAAGSVGFQIGIQNTEVIMLIMNDGALQSLVKNQGKLGADAGVTVGLVGIGLEGSTTTNLGVDVLAYANSILGAYAGVTLEGAALVRRADLNQAFYNSSAAPADILGGSVRQPIADPLSRALGTR